MSDKPNGENGKNKELLPGEAPPTTALAKIGAGRRGLILGTFDDMQRFGKAILASGLAPKGDTLPAIVVKMELGAELGIPPMQALKNIAVINGRPSIFGDLGLALAENSGKLEDFREEPTHENVGADPNTWPDDYGWTATGKRVGRSLATSRTFTVAMAKRAKLWKKLGPWQEYTSRMLQMRSRWWMLRDLFADVLSGISGYEEAIDMPAVEVEVVESPLADGTHKLGEPENVPAAQDAVADAPQPEPPPDVPEQQVEQPTPKEEVAEKPANALPDDDNRTIAHNLLRCIAAKAKPRTTYADELTLLNAKALGAILGTEVVDYEPDEAAKAVEALTALCKDRKYDTGPWIRPDGPEFERLTIAAE